MRITLQQQMAALSLTALLIAAGCSHSPKGQFNNVNNLSKGGNTLTNAGSAANAGSAFLTVCPGSDGKVLSQYLCSEAEAPFMGDPSTRQMSLQQIKDMASRLIEDAQAGNVLPGFVDEYILHVGMELNRIGYSRGESSKMYQCGPGIGL